MDDNPSATSPDYLARAKGGVAMRHTGNRRSVPERRDAVAARVRALVSERVRFLRSFLASPRRVGAILPTSERTVRAMLDMAPIARAGCVVELGAGTGPHTREILRRIGPQGRLLA